MKIDLLQVTSLQVICLMDNSIDFLSSNTNKEIQSYRQWANKPHPELPFAEHGLSFLLKVSSSVSSNTILFDTGVSSDGVVMNARRMHVDLTDVSNLILSHGHYDHFGGLVSAVKAIGRSNLPILVHEDTAKRRAMINSKGAINEFPSFPPFDKLEPATIMCSLEPRLIAGNMACISGEIPRLMSFEEQSPSNKIFKNGEWKPDSVNDDQALILCLKGKGLVVITGCAHAGVINTVQYAKRITGIDDVYAIIGGFHLAGKTNESKIEKTVKVMKEISPKLIIPSHCTGWRAMFAIANAFPDAFAWNGVGNLYRFNSLN